MIDYVSRLVRWMAWADQRTADALQSAPAAQPEALPLLAHLVAAEHIWLCRIEQRDAHLATWPNLALQECRRVAEENAAAYLALLGRLRPDDLGRLTAYRNQAGTEFQTALGDILLHVVTHGGYHRGQIAKAIGRARGLALSTDYIAYVREAPQRAI